MNKIAIVRVVRDLRAESSDEIVRQKYGLAPGAFRRLLQLMVSKGAVEHEELCNISATYCSMVKVISSRTYPRTKVRVRISVHNDASSQRGYLRDISENGIRVAGIDAKHLEILTLRLPLDEIPEGSPLTFEGVCRWSKIKGKKAKYVVSGFEIVKISDESANRFVELMEFCQSKAREANGHDASVRFEELGKPCGSIRAETKSRIFSGTLDGIDILDVVQLILLNGNRLKLQIESLNGESGEMYLDNGRILHAAQGAIEGEEAFFKCMNFPGGRFSTKSWSSLDKRTIQSPGELLMMQAAQQRDESTDNGDCVEITAEQGMVPEASAN
jgi:hypothetical protein